MREIRQICACCVIEESCRKILVMSSEYLRYPFQTRDIWNNFLVRSCSRDSYPTNLITILSGKFKQLWPTPTPTLLRVMRTSSNYIPFLSLLPRPLPSRVPGKLGTRPSSQTNKNGLKSAPSRHV